MADTILAPAADPSPAEVLGTPPAADPAPAAAAPAEGETEHDPIPGAADALYGEKPAAPAPEVKPGEEAPKDEGKSGEETPKDEQKPDERYGAPEGDATYEAFNLPEGFAMDEAGAADVAALGKELNLSQASAQKLVDKVVEMRQRDAQALENVHTEWQNAAKTDKEFGGDKLNESLAVAQKALKEFGTPELGELLTGARLGNHPEIIRLLVRVGQRISEAPIVNGGKPVQNASAASTLYPSLK